MDNSRPSNDSDVALCLVCAATVGRGDQAEDDSQNADHAKVKSLRSTNSLRHLERMHDVGQLQRPLLGKEVKGRIECAGT